MSFSLTGGKGRLRGDIYLPGDKSIAHRAVIFSCLSRGRTTIENFPFQQDAASTVNIFRKLGISVTEYPHRQRICIMGSGMRGLRPPSGPLFAGESGTTFRLMAGILAGQSFPSELTAAPSLCKRPMGRITVPLRLMGADISARVAQEEEYAPLKIAPSRLSGISYKLPVASAQVKSAMLLAGLYAKGPTRITEPDPTRDHTERMLALFRSPVERSGNNIFLKPPRELKSPGTVVIPGDISSAAFFIVAALIVPDSVLVLRNVSMNPTRAGCIDVLKRMGANIRIEKVRTVPGAEPVADIRIVSGVLSGTKVKENEVPFLIDELPILMVAASFAKGASEFQGVEELRVKETDRIDSMADNLQKMGARVAVRTRHSKNGEREDVTIEPAGRLRGASVKSYNDHRTAMSMIVAAAAAQGTTELDDTACIAKSFPDFVNVFESLFRGHNT